MFFSIDIIDRIKTIAFMYDSDINIMFKYANKAISIATSLKENMLWRQNILKSQHRQNKPACGDFYRASFYVKSKHSYLT